MTVRVLLTGAEGFLGSRIRQAMAVTASPSLRDATEDSLKRLLDSVMPDVILHTAAISDTGLCQRKPEASLEANVLLPERLARAARGAKLILFSSDQVYNGSSAEAPMTEDTPLDPTTVYGQHKLEMEQRVLDAAPQSVVLRATWLFDLPAYGAAPRGNFLTNVLKAALTRTPLTLPMDQHRDLTWARDAASVMQQVIGLPGGVYNFGSENPMTVGDTARWLLEKLGAGDLPMVAGEMRPSLWMDSGKLHRQGISLGVTADGLARCAVQYALMDEG